MKELEDHEWFPKIFRRYQTDYIGFVVSRFGIYTPFIQYISQQGDLPANMYDLCSGSGEPAVTIFKQSEIFKTLTLSDKFPNPDKTFGQSIAYINQPMDVLSASFFPTRTYSMFNAFHHFTEKEQLKIISTMIDSGAKGFFVEILSPGFFNYFKILFATTIGTLLLTPFIQPFSLTRLFFTYILPVNIFTITFDGLLSVMKSKSVNQYKELFKPFNDRVEVFELKKRLNPLTVIRVN